MAATPSFLYPSTASVSAVVRAAGDYWQTIYTFSSGDTLTIDWGFCDAANIPSRGSTAAVIQLPLKSNGIIIHGSIAINSTQDFYVDSAPTTWSEYPGSVTSTNIPYFHHPGQYVEDERYTGASTSGDSHSLDLFTGILHEMGICSA